MGTKYGFTIEAGLKSNHLTDAHYIKGGYFTVKNIAERNALKVATDTADGTIVKGSLCYCQDEEEFYKFNGVSWEEADFGGGTTVNNTFNNDFIIVDGAVGTEGLSFIESADGTCSVSGGSKTDYTTVVIPATYNGKAVTRIGDQAFGFCYDLTSVVIPNSVTKIGDWAFRDCSSLTSITIPDSVTSIGTSAFVDCPSLTSITIPDSVTSIGCTAFLNCPSLTIYCEDKSKPDGWDDEWNPDNRPVVWGFANDFVAVQEKFEESTYIFGRPYAPSEGLEFTFLEDTQTYSVTGIGTCKDSTVVIPAYHEGKMVTEIGEEAFQNVSHIHTVVLPDSITTIGASAFQGCIVLFTVVISESVSTIGSNAFNESPVQTIYCEAKSKPDGWDDEWNPQSCPVVWGCAWNILKLNEKINSLIDTALGGILNGEY